eukprot:TRINITY_DN5081_c0_g1_i1.p1 TRINITY_DN5081_c0_g1~~TRINITY_DN5081_c0_g1_i1.p1  ORF type:complete len:110 (+),score=15.92 TRINITY_DN5081_c0_g1_i1:35-364(+)
MDLNMKDSGSKMIQKTGRIIFIQRLWNVLKERNSQEKSLIKVVDYHRFLCNVEIVVSIFVLHALIMGVMIADQLRRRVGGLIGNIVNVKKKNVFNDIPVSYTHLTLPTT